MKATATISGPNDCVSRRLGSQWVFFFYSSNFFFFILTKSVDRFSNVPKRRDPNDGVTVVWAPVLLYYAQPPTRTRHHGHVTTPSYQQQVAGDEGSRPARLEPLAVCFFFLSLIILINLHLQLYLQNQYQYQHQYRPQQPTRKGPNDARRVVWALSEFFF